MMKIRKAEAGNRVVKQGGMESGKLGMKYNVGRLAASEVLYDLQFQVFFFQNPPFQSANDSGNPHIRLKLCTA